MIYTIPLHPLIHQILLEMQNVCLKTRKLNRPDLNYSLKTLSTWNNPLPPPHRQYLQPTLSLCNSTLKLIAIKHPIFYLFRSKINIILKSLKYKLSGVAPIGAWSSRRSPIKFYPYAWNNKNKTERISTKNYFRDFRSILTTLFWHFCFTLDERVTDTYLDIHL